MEQADFVIVGAGSAGCAMAYRLSEGGKNSVAVLEYGGTDAGPLIQMPAALSYPMNMARYDWGYRTEPEPYLDGRQLACPRGKVIGGSSSINGMVYVRGHAGDYDGWEDMGADGWGFRHVLPYFQRMETSRAGEAGWRGTDGPLHVQRGARTNPLYQAFVKAGIQAGYVATDDYNGAQQEGFGAMEMTVSGGRRWSAANAYLRPALKRPEVRLIGRALVHKVTIEGGRAVGVEYQQGTKRLEIRARREVILAASSINSPKLLMLSGIGPQLHLRELGIPVHADRRGVGANLMDHLELYIQQACTQPISLYSQLGLVSKARIGLQWLLFKSGLGATNHFEACAFIRSQAGIRYPDIQYHFLPVAIRYDGTAPAEGHGFQAHVGPMRASSRGTVRLRSAESNAPPKIIFNYLETLQDREAFRTCIKLTRELFRQAAFDPYRGAELAPGPEVVDDEALDAYAREHVESAYHPCGTCKMGAATDPDAVVDSECCVIGVDQLRVADSSIFPRIPNGNLNGPSIMVGEKASDHILGVRPLAPSNLEPWFHPHWQTEQR